MRVLHIDGFTYSNWKPVLSMGHQNIGINLNKRTERLTPLEKPHDRSIALVGYAPSIKVSYPQLKNYDDILTCSGAYNFLLEKGIVANYHAECDPRDHKAVFSSNPHPDTEFWMATTVAPITIDKLADHKVKLWNIWTLPDMFVYPDDEFTYPVSGCIGQQLLWLAYSQGYRKFGIFGMDCSYHDDACHAGPHNNPVREEAEYICVGDYEKGKTLDQYQTFKTEQVMIIYALEWRRLMTEVFTDCYFETICAGLMPAVLQHNCMLPDGNHRTQKLRQNIYAKETLWAKLKSPPQKITRKQNGTELQEGVCELPEQRDSETPSGTTEQSPSAVDEARSGA